MADAKVRDVYKIGKTLGTGGELLVHSYSSGLLQQGLKLFQGVHGVSTLCKQALYM